MVLRLSYLVGDSLLNSFSKLEINYA